MEKLTIAHSAEGFRAGGYESFLREVDLRAAQILRMDVERGTFSEILWVRPKRPDLLPEQWLSRPEVVEGRFLRPEGEEWVVWAVVRMTPVLKRLWEPFPDLFLANFAYTRGPKFHFGVIGERERLQAFLERGLSLGLPFEAVRFEELSAKAHDHLEDLTPRQREILRAAYALGYFETPRRVKLRDLARMVGRDSSSVMALLRRAQKRVLQEAFG
jgi:hypothetical protein